MSQSRFAEAIGALATALEGQRWYLFGAQAAILYGAPRMSEDVDATVFIAKGSTATSILPLLEAGGFRALVQDPEFFERTRVVPAIHETTGIPLDLVVAGPGLEEVFYPSNLWAYPSIARCSATSSPAVFVGSAFQRRIRPSSKPTRT